MTVGAAVELNVSLTLASVETTLNVSDQKEVLDTSRTEIAGTVPQTEVTDLPLNGRNFLDLALVVPGVSPTNTASNQLFAETSAVPGQGISVGSQRNFSNSFIVDGLSANDDAAGLSGMFYGLDVVSEFQVVTSGGQAEFGRALGGYINVVTKSGTNTLHGDLYGYFRNQRFNAANALSHTALPLTQAQYGATLGGPLVRDRTFYFANFEQRELNQSGLITIAPANVAAINARLASVGYRGPRLSTGLYSNPVHMTTFLGKVDHQFNEKDQFSVRYSLYDVNSRNSRGAGGLMRRKRLGQSGRYRSDGCREQRRDAVVAYGQRNSRAVHAQQPACAAVRPDRSGGQHFRSGYFRNVVGFSDGAAQQALRSCRQPVVSGGSARVARRRRLSVQRRHHHLSALDSRQLFLFVAGEFPERNIQQLGFYADIRQLGRSADQSECRRLCTGRMESQPPPDFEPRRSLRSAVSEDDRHGYQQRFAARRLRVVAVWRPGHRGSRQLRSFLRSRAAARAGQCAALGGQHGRHRQLEPDQHQSFSDAKRGACFPEHPQQPGDSARRAVQLHHHEPAHAECLFGAGQPRDRAAARTEQHAQRRLSARARTASDCFGESERAGLRGVGQQQWMPSESELRQQQPVFPLADSHYDGLHVSFVQRPARWGHYRVSYTYSKALDNVGEFFFSSPIDNFNIWQDYGRSDDDQRHRLVFDGTIHTSTGDAQTSWQRISHGFQLAAMLQYYSALPFNITSGATTIQGTTARPTVNGAFISRNAGNGFDFFNVNTRLSRTFRTKESLRVEVSAEAFNLLNHTNGVTLNGSFGTGAYPSNPLSDFQTSHCCC